MKKLKISQEQYNRLFANKSLSESTDIKGGLNRVNKSFATALGGGKVKNLSEEPFNVKAPTPGIPNSTMKPKKETNLNEEEGTGSYQAIHDFIENIWMNPTVKKLDPFFQKANLSWEDVVSYLIAAGILEDAGEKGIKVKNFYKTKYGKNHKEAVNQKLEDIDKLSKMLDGDTKAPWNGAKKVKSEMAEEEGAVNEPENVVPQQLYTPVVMGLELLILKGPDGFYVFNLDDVSKEDLPETGVDISVDDVVRYVNSNTDKIEKGEGVKAFDAGIPLVKVDDALKNEIIQLYSKDKKFIAALQQLQEMTSAAGGSSGAFVGPLGSSPKDNMVTRGYSKVEELSEVENEDEKTLDEVTTAVPNNATSSSTGAYVQPAIWAKDKKNWAGNKKTQYPHGEMVEFDPCTKLNNNKEAQNGKCSTGAVDNVVKTHRTKQSVISKTVYETIAKKTGRTVEDIKKVIETKLNNGKSLS